MDTFHATMLINILAFMGPDEAVKSVVKLSTYLHAAWHILHLCKYPPLPCSYKSLCLMLSKPPDIHNDHHWCRLVMPPVWRVAFVTSFRNFIPKKSHAILNKVTPQAGGEPATGLHGESSFNQRQLPCKKLHDVCFL